MSQQKILGDYQTPLPLTLQIISKLFSTNNQWKRVLEPTCGLGNFIQALVDLDLSIDQIIGLDIQPEYVKHAQQIESDCIQITIHQQDIFDSDLSTSLEWDTSHPLLIVGNPPWVTNSALGSLNGDNLPTKSNFQKLSGLDALTGKSNFDIAESIWLRLLNEFASEPVTVALLCKTSVARKVVQHIYQQKLPASDMAIYRIDSKRWFDVAVDAGLFVVTLNQGQPAYEVQVYESLSAQSPSQIIGFMNQHMIADVTTYNYVDFVDGQACFEWRQGVKHDVSKVMELVYQQDRYVNGYGETVDIELDYIYPLIKSSDVKAISSDFQPRKHVIITQTSLQQNTAQLEAIAPKFWKYLNSHADKFDARKSSIYAQSARFSIFGIGDYSFAPYKIVIAGFYLPAKFMLVSTYQDKVYLTDDTCYFLSFNTAWKALIVNALLNHTVVTQFIESIVFEDSKRPITKSLLSRIDLKAVYEAIPFDDLWTSAHDIKQQYNLETAIPTDPQQIQSLFGRQLRLL